MTTTPTQPMQDQPCTVPNMPKVAKVEILTRAPHVKNQWPMVLHEPVRQTAIVQVVDFYPGAEIIRRTAKHWEVTC